jgi:hypothetical protein
VAFRRHGLSGAAGGDHGGGKDKASNKEKQLLADAIRKAADN